MPRSAEPPPAERGRRNAGTGHKENPAGGTGAAGSADELSARWRAALPSREEDPAAARRLTQGLAFYRSGRVAGLRLAPGRLAASVQGARATPYHVEVLVGVLDDATWDEVIEVVAGDLRLAAALLAGRWPDGLADALASRGIDVVGRDVAPDTRCPCGEPEWPCAHLAALWEAAAARIEADPFALLHLRGRGRQRFHADLSVARRGHGSAAEARVPLDELPAEGWARSPSPLADLDVAARPEAPAAALRLLGDPPGWAGTTSAQEAFAPLVEGAARYAELLARGERGSSVRE